MARYFVFVTATAPGVACLGHYELPDAPGPFTRAWWERHAWGDNRQLSPTPAKGPNGIVYRPTPSLTYLNPPYRMSWAPKGAGFTITIGSVVYSWQPVNDPDDPLRYECGSFLSGWGAGFGYFSESLVSAPIIFDSTGIAVNTIAIDYAGQQYTSKGGQWLSDREGAGFTVINYWPTANQNVWTFRQPADDGTNLNDLGSFALNAHPHSKQIVTVYGGHDFNKDSQENLLDGGHAWIGYLVKQNGRFSRMVYLENSYQVSDFTGNILSIAYLAGGFFS